MNTKNIEEFIKEAEKQLRKESKSNHLKVTVGVGAGMYLLGKAKGKRIGFDKGKVEGYIKALADVTEEVRNRAKSK